jgi:hypothetical protein
MNKREFLAAGGAVPLMLAGCGGSGGGSAPVRLVNASVGYPHLGFMVESTQASAADVLYGATGPFVNVEAGAVAVTLTVSTDAGTNSSATSGQTRTISKDSRYSLVAYGYADLLKFLLLAESTVDPDAGKTNVNVLNTSVDIGAVDIYLSAGKDLSVSTQLVAGLPGVQQSAFAGILAGSYYVTVTGFQDLTDVRFQSPTPIVLTALQVMTIILTPGASGTLANAIILTQGTAGTSTYLPNTTARVRAVTSTNGQSTAVAGLLGSTTTSQYTNYGVVTTGAPPAVTVNGATVTPFMYETTTSGGVTTVGTTPTAAVLSAGGDYTLMVYLDSSNAPVAQLIQDDNTAPVLAQGVKFRLVNLAANDQSLQLSMSVNSINIASLVTYSKASAYTEITTPQTVNSKVEIFNGTDVVATHGDHPLLLGNIFTDFVVSVDPNTGVAKDFFRAASGN